MTKISLRLHILSMVCVLLFASNVFSNEGACSGIAAGTKAYNEGDFERAIDEWRTCVDNDFKDPDLLYNLGNAYFRNKNIGFAIYYYKLALKLQPNNEDYLHNLKFAQAMTRDKAEDDDEENPILSTLFNIHHALSLNTQLYLLRALFWMIILILIVQRFATREKQKNICTGAVFFLAAIICITAVSSGYKIFVLETNISGVVTSIDADVTSAPSDKSQTLNTLSEGTSFDVLGEQGNFIEIRLGEKIRGFVRKSDVGIVQ